ncbi:hypothetical protein E8E13_002087 [Curvularia kusanoi]|uniref:Uncharacterized protein n=1 Tax=Curvularia kusanoi TaxID=90978 RepID=A0A9P4T798_CURKU|nr:hypothetical protein E8E13_002087 [Curvularia kusanoi]
MGEEEDEDEDEEEEDDRDVLTDERDDEEVREDTDGEEDVGRKVLLWLLTVDEEATLEEPDRFRGDMCASIRGRG